MNFLTVVVLSVAMTMANAAPSLLGPGILLAGPGAKAGLAGPDGSLITAAAQGGAVSAGLASGGLVAASPAVATAAIATPTLGLGLGLGPIGLAAPGLLVGQGLLAGPGLLGTKLL